MTAKRMKIWKKFSLWIVCSLGLLAIVVAVVGWKLSTPFTTNQWDRIKQSKQFDGKTFINTVPEGGAGDVIDSLRQSMLGDEERVPISILPVDDISADMFENAPKPGLRIAWLGHATSMVEIGGKRIMFDPVLSERASPFSSFGPKRFHRSPIRLDHIKGIDAVFISHNHYDHFDRVTIQRLAATGTQIFVPVGLKSTLQSWGVSDNQISEVDWWQESTFSGLTIVPTPARHYSNRGLFDFKKTLWVSWSVISSEHRVFFSGDSGYSSDFAKIGAAYGPFDATLIKIGAYGPGEFWQDVHMTPEESMQTHLDLRGKVMVPVHWATFNLAYHDWREPIQRAITAAQDKGIRLATPRIGQMFEPDEPLPRSKWWEQVK